MKATILITITDGQVRCELGCDTHGAQEVLEPILSEIRRVVEEALESVEADELAATLKD